MEYSPELKKVVEILAARISVNGHQVQLTTANYGAIEQIFDAYAAVKIRRIAALPDFDSVKDELFGWANSVEKGMV